MDKPNASLPWASSQVPRVGSRLPILPDRFWYLSWEQLPLISLSPVVETDRLIGFRSVYEACCSHLRGGQGHLPAWQV